MGENILIPENAKFEQVKPWGKNATKTNETEADPQDPEVYFTFCFCCNKDLDTILQRVRPEWRRQLTGTEGAGVLQHRDGACPVFYAQ